VQPDLWRACFTRGSKEPKKAKGRWGVRSDFNDQDVQSRERQIAREREKAVWVEKARDGT